VGQGQEEGTTQTGDTGFWPGDRLHRSRVGTQQGRNAEQWPDEDARGFHELTWEHRLTKTTQHTTSPARSTAPTASNYPRTKAQLSRARAGRVREGYRHRALLHGRAVFRQRYDQQAFGELAKEILRGQAIGQPVTISWRSTTRDAVLPVIEALMRIRTQDYDDADAVIIEIHRGKRWTLRLGHVLARGAGGGVRRRRGDYQVGRRRPNTWDNNAPLVSQDESQGGGHEELWDRSRVGMVFAAMIWLVIADLPDSKATIRMPRDVATRETYRHTPVSPSR